MSEERVVHKGFDDAMQHIQNNLGELNYRRRFMFVLAEVSGQEVKVHRTTWNFPVGKYQHVMSKLRELLIDDVLPPMPDPLPDADLDEDILQYPGATSPEDLGVDVPTSPDAEVTDASS